MRTFTCLVLSILTIVLVTGCAPRRVINSRANTPRVCPVHGDSLRPDTIRHTGGILPEELVPEWHEAMEDRFPYAGTYSGSGCGTELTLVRVKYCPDCRRARASFFRDPRHSHKALLQALQAQADASQLDREPE